MIGVLLSSQMRRKDRTRFRGSIGRPVRVVNTRPRPGPGATHVGAIGLLSFGLNLERLANNVEQREPALACACLDRRLEQLARDALQLLANPDRPGVEVDVLPAQTKRLATPQAVEDEHGERGVQRVILGCGQELSQLIGPRWDGHYDDPMSGDDRTELPLRASDGDRESVAGLLGEALADGRLTVDEHRERIELLYASRTHDELVPLTADLGSGRHDIERQRSAVPVERLAPQVAILSSTMARPTGRVEGRMVAVGFAGEARIDLTYASLDQDGVEITALAIVGSVNVVVPPEARVTLTGFPLLGELSPTREPGPGDGPHVKVSAFALVGSVTIHRAEVKEGDS
jgi:hypothetical protein